MKTRKERREEAAHKVMRELRWQIANGHLDYSKIQKNFFIWFNNSNKDKYERP